MNKLDHDQIAILLGFAYLVGAFLLFKFIGWAFRNKGKRK